MVRRVAAVGGLVVLGVVLAGCGSSGEASSADCTPMTDQQLQALSEGLAGQGAELTRGAFYPIPDGDQDLGYTQLAAVEVKGPDSTDVVTLASSEDGAGNTIALDNVAQVYFNLGSAAQDGSPVATWRDGMIGSETDTAAKGCLS